MMDIFDPLGNVLDNIGTDWWNNDWGFEGIGCAPQS